MSDILLISALNGFWNAKITDVFSLLLTLALFIVYWKMKNIQNEQNRIQKQQNRLMSRQTDLMAADHQPRLERDNINAEGDMLRVSLSNYGNGPAENLHVQCIVYQQKYSDEDKPLYRKGFEREGTAVVPKWNPFTRPSPDAIITDGGSSQQALSNHGLKEGDDGAVFEAEIKMKPLAPGIESYEAPFSEVIQRINREWKGSDYIAIEFWLAFNDVTNRPHGWWLGSFRDIKLKSDLTLEEALKSGTEGERIGDPVSEDEASSMMLIDFDDMGFGG